MYGGWHSNDGMMWEEAGIMHDEDIAWLSRHPLTPDQERTLKSAGYTCKLGNKSVTFSDNILEDIKKVTWKKVIAGVFPVTYALILLRAGYTIIDFVNVPGARDHGGFVCKGMNIHTLDSTEFIPCPK
jgi:hypothetical protein